MSYIGQSPTVKRTRFTPQATDPVSPTEGDLYYSNGTPRAEGLWYYKDAAWQQVIADNSTITALTLSHLTFTPLSADPSTPSTGEVFYSDGTSREAGLWIFNGTNWVQISRTRSIEFFYKPTTYLTAASTVNVAINGSTPIFNGQTLDGVTLSTGNLVLLRNQTTTSQNGVYVVPATQQALSRSTAYDTAYELTRASVYIPQGTVNAHITYVQNNTITTVGADAQSWTTTLSNFTWTVPQDVYEIQMYGVGAGGGGGGGGFAALGYGGGGGAGSRSKKMTLSVVPGATVTVNIGKGGAGGAGATGAGAASSGSIGGDSSVTYNTLVYNFYGVQGGFGATANTNVGQGISTSAGVFTDVIGSGTGGISGAGQVGTNGTAGFPTINIGGVGGQAGIGAAGGGGGGGASDVQPISWGTSAAGYGGQGSNGATGGTPFDAFPGGIGAGGGGGGGGASAAGGRGGIGGHGWIKFIY